MHIEETTKHLICRSEAVISGARKGLERQDTLICKSDPRGNLPHAASDQVSLALWRLPNHFSLIGIALKQRH